MRELAEAKLCAAGYDVVLAENGADALEIVKNDNIDLLISDIEMPMMDGFELTRSIRAERAIAETPIIVITGSDYPEAVERVFAEGATSFLAKPINWTLFTQSVMFVLRASQDKENLRIARDQADAAAKFKDALMSVMSHELRTPLNAIIGFGQLLGERFDEQQDTLHKEYSKYIVDGGKRLLSTVSDMLLASDARSGPIKLNETDATIAEIVEAARNEALSVNPAEGATFAVRIQDPQLEICCDRGLLARAIAKLVGNSLKFSQKDVEITIGAALSKAGDLAILVKDNGPGIAPEKLTEIGAPFEQSDMSLRRSKEGLGLGLPMTKAIAAAHGAQFRLDSAPGDGARALIVIPAERVRARSASGDSAAA
jgi:signal transduction histidine kinase